MTLRRQRASKAETSIKNDKKRDIFDAIQDFKTDAYQKTNTNEQTISEFIAIVMVKSLSSDSEDREPI